MFNNTDLFSEINVNNNVVITRPIFLIDCSGSTNSIMYNNKTILDVSIDKMKNIVNNNNIEESYIMFWDNKQSFRDELVKSDTIDEYIKSLQIGSGGTYISKAINAIPETWYQEETTIYIITDGDICDNNEFSKSILNLLNKKIYWNIITVENNNKNYIDNHINAGSTIFSAIQSNNLTKYIQSFNCYNQLYIDNEFTNFINPKLEQNQFSFNKFVFNNTDFIKFIDILSNIIESNKDNKDVLDNIIYNLAFSVYNYTLDKSKTITSEIINLCVDLFENVYDDLNYIKNLIDNEIKSHNNNKSLSFRQYIENRNKLFERAQEELESNVRGCISKGFQFISIPILTKDNNIVKMVESNDMNVNIHMDDIVFNNGGIKYENYTIPMLSVKMSKSIMSKQTIRQWIRAIYSRLFNIQINDDKILYLFLTDVLSIYLSDLPQYIKDSYVEYGYIMLESKRFNSNGTMQIDWLLDGNKPSLSKNGNHSIENIFQYCISHFNPTLDINTDDMWYGICHCLDNPKLFEQQVPQNYLIDDLLTKLKNNNKTYILENIQYEQDLEYTDYITLEDTSLIGGYKLPDFKIGKKTYRNRIVISEESYQYLIEQSTDGTTKCPITNTFIELNKFIKVSPKNNIIQQNVFDSSNFNMDIFNTNNYKYLKYDNLLNLDSNTLVVKNVSEYDFTNYPYFYDNKMNIITNELYMRREQNINTSDFRNQYSEKYDWINKLDFDNMVIAGGFCKSIILNQPVNDIDFYFYGLDENEYNNRLSKLISELYNLIPEYYNKTLKSNEEILTLKLYKPEFNVYEVVFFKNNTNNKTRQYNDKLVKVQIILLRNDNLNSILSGFDLDSSCVLWNGKQLMFNDRGYYSYKYMINIVRCSRYSKYYEQRLVKYYNNGFNIVLPSDIKFNLGKNTMNNIKLNVSKINNNKFCIDNINLESKFDNEYYKHNDYYNSIFDEDNENNSKYIDYLQNQEYIFDLLSKDIITILKDNQEYDKSKITKSDIKNFKKNKQYTEFFITSKTDNYDITYLNDNMKIYYKLDNNKSKNKLDQTNNINEFDNGTIDFDFTNLDKYESMHFDNEWYKNINN